MIGKTHDLGHICWDDRIRAHNRQRTRACALLPNECEVNDPRYSGFIAWTKARIQSHNDRLTAPSIIGRLASAKLFEPNDN